MLPVFLTVILGFVLAPVAPWIHRRMRKLAGWILALYPSGVVVYFLSLSEAVSDGSVLAISMPWATSLGTSMSFYVDGLSLLFTIIISGIGALIVIYAQGYLGGHHHLGRFYCFILMFMSSMLGLVLADNVITLFIFWELTSISSYLLIGFDHERAEARAAALQALFVTGLGGFAMLIGLLLLSYVGNSYELSELVHRGDLVHSHPYYIPILLLVLAGAFTKSAQFPFHFWLPNAMEAPTPVSAYLHSATMVKAGVYLIARLNPLIGETDTCYYIVTLVGVVTMLVGAAIALVQTDLKRILAYSTVSALGTLTLLLGLGTTQAAEAAMVFLVVHSLYKGALFLVAGAIDHETGMRNVGGLGGLSKAMPMTAVASVLAALSMAGLPPMFGFISKELLYEAKLQAPSAAEYITWIGVFANSLIVSVALIVGIRPFFGTAKPTPRPAHEAPFPLLLGPAILAIGGFVIGLFPGIISTLLISPAVTAVRDEPTVVKLALWHGVNPVLALSGITLLCGTVVFALRHPIHNVVERIRFVSKWGANGAYEFLLSGLKKTASLQTRILQSGYLRVYLLIILATMVAFVGVPLLSDVEFHGLGDWKDFRPYELVIVLVVLGATLMAVVSSSRLIAILALGAIGYGVALLFLLFGAPDVAMTQFAIETLTVFLFVLVLYRLPRFVSFSSIRSRLRDAAVALTVGGLFTTVILSVAAIPVESRISPYFAEHSLLFAKGRNIVNVILVDFRVFDTLGEIIVLAIAGIGVYALLRLIMEEESGS